MSIRAQITADGTQYVKTLNTLRNKTAQFGSSIKGMLAGAFGVGAITSLIRSTISFGSEMSDLALRTKTTVREFMVFRDAARDAGVAQSVLERALRNVVQRTQAAIDGNKTYAKSIERLGLNLNEFGRLSTAEQFIAIANAANNSTNETEAFRDVAVILGERAGPMLTEVLKRLATEGFEGVAESAVVMTDEMAQTLDQAEDAIQRFKERVIIAMGEVIMKFEEVFDKAQSEQVEFDLADNVAKELEKVKGVEFSFMDESMLRGAELYDDIETLTKILEKHGLSVADYNEAKRELLARLETPAPQPSTSQTVQGGSGAAPEVDEESRIKSKEKERKLDEQIQAERERRAQLSMNAEQKYEAAKKKSAKITEEILNLQGSLSDGPAASGEMIQAKILELEKARTEEARALLDIQKKSNDETQYFVDTLKDVNAEITGYREQGSEVLKSDDQKLFDAVKKEASLQEELAALKKEADKDGIRDAKEKLDIAQKILEIEQGIADAKTVIAGAKEEIESRRRAREEAALSPEELLARREKESAAARAKLRKEKAKAAEDGITTEAEKAIIATRELDVEKAIDAELAARKALEDQAGGGPGIVASSLAAIGGGGGVASFTQDPLLSENKRQTQVLEAIRDGLRGAELETASREERPEL